MSAMKLWVAFFGASLLTVVVYRFLWSTAAYYLILSLLGVTSCLVAFLIMRKTGSKVWPIAAVTVGLLIGQWWFVENVVLRTFWHFGGFAP
jgi:hypothetical protein